MRPDFMQYLRTPEWQRKRMDRLRMDDFRCCRCGSKRDIQVHHLTYKNLGNEDINNDLITLCDNCHESIENEVTAGSRLQIRTPVSICSNYGIAEVFPLPAEGAIIFRDMRDIDRSRQLQFKGGKIRLCEAHLAPSDYLNDRNGYEEACRCADALLGKPESLAKYEDYQWENHDKWRVLVEADPWYTEGLSQVVLSGEFRLLNNGILCLHAKNYYAWEAYESPTKEQAEAIAKKMEECEKNIFNLLGLATFDTPHA